MNFIGRPFHKSWIWRLNLMQLEIETLWKNKMGLIFSVIKNFIKTIKKLEIVEKTLNEDIVIISFTLHKVSDKLAIVVARGQNWFHNIWWMILYAYTQSTTIQLRRVAVEIVVVPTHCSIIVIRFEINTWLGMSLLIWAQKF